MVMYYQQDHCSSGVVINDEFHYPISATIKTGKKYLRMLSPELISHSILASSKDRLKSSNMLILVAFGTLKLFSKD
ncbi:hypothetical protein ACTXT7_002073 [Hymenolepis weldensis]